MAHSISLNVAGASAGASSDHAFHTVQLNGYCSVKGSSDVACLVIGVAYDAGVALSTAEASFADEVLLALPHLGLQKGVVSRVFDGGFEFHFAQSAYAKLWPYLNWLTDATKRPDQEHRDQERLVPIRKLIELERSNEPASMARIVDLSRSGVAFTTSKALAVDELVVVGGHSGRVIRVFEGGAAVQFDDMIPPDRFDVMIDLAAA